MIAGGLGTRLRPLTYTHPKPLIPLLNRPMILHILDRLPREVDHIILPVNYMLDRMREFFHETDVGRNVNVIEERRPLGTGGALKNLEHILESRFLVFNGDVICSINVNELLWKHEKSGGIATIALWEVDDPSTFGAVDIREKDRIVKFVEKPKPGEEPSNLINAGVYVFNREVLKYIQKGKKVSIEKEVFPKLIRKGVYGHRFEGYWADAGTRKNYLRSLKMMLASMGNSINRSVKIEEGAEVQNPVFMGSGCVVRGVVGPNSSLGKECVIDKSAVIDSALFDRVEVHKDAIVRGSIVGQDADIRKGAIVLNTIIGDRGIVKAGEKVGSARVRQ